MKELIMICLLAGCSPCFAQQIGVKELLRVMETPDANAVSQPFSSAITSIIFIWKLYPTAI